MISILPPDPTNPDAQPISISPLDTPKTYTEDYANKKSVRYGIALGEASPGIDVLRNDVALGEGNKWDQILATNEAVKSQRLRNEIIQQVAQNRDPNALPTNDELLLVNGLSNDALHAPNVSTVLSKVLAEKYVNLTASVPEAAALQDGLEKDPVRTLQGLDRSSFSAQRNLIAQDVASEFQKRYQDVSWWSTGWSFAKSLVPGYTNIISRNPVSGSPASPLLAGTNWAENISYLYSLPPEAFHAKLTAAVKDIENRDPLIAKDFVQAVQSFSTSDKNFSNLGDIIDAATLLPITGAAKGGRLLTKTEITNMQKSFETVARNLSPEEIAKMQQKFNNLPGRVLSENEIADMQKSFNKGRSLTPDEITKMQESFNKGRFLTPDEIETARKGMSDLVRKDIAEGNAFEKLATAVKHDPQDIPRIAGEVGLHDIAAKADVAKNIAKGDPTGLGTIGAKDLTEVETRLPTTLSPGRAFSETVDLSGASKQRAAEAILRAQTTDAIANTVRVDRLEPHQLNIGAQEAFDKIKDTFTSVNHNIIDQAIHPASADPLTNLYSVSVRFGNRDGTLFESEDAARNFVRRNIGPKTSDFEIRQEGIGGYYVEVRRNVSEVDAVRNMEIPTEFQTPDTLANRLLSGVRSADYQLPQQNVTARGRVTHSSEYMAEALKRVGEPIAALDKKARKELERLAASDRTNSKWSRSPADFDANFLAVNNKMPTAAQRDAYRAYLDLADIDYTIRAADVVTQKARLGGEKFSFKAFSKKADGSVEETQKAFDGVEVSNLPYGSERPFFVQVIDGKNPEVRVFSNFLGDKARAEIQKKLDDGYKIIQNGEESTYYIIKNFKRDRLTMDLGHTEGGHHIYKYNWYGKQGKVSAEAHGVRNYTGDLSLFSAPTQQAAKEISELMDRARILVRDNDPGANAFFKKHLSDVITMQEFMKKVGAGVIKLDVPILATRAGQRTLDVSDWAKSFENFVDSTSSPHNPFRSVGGRFIGEQDEHLLDVLKTEGDRVVKSNLEPLMAPFDALRTATQSLLDTRVVNDYRQKAAADWVQEFGHTFNADLNKVYANPLEFLQRMSYKDGADPRQVRASENVRLRTLELNNYRNTLERNGQAFKDSLVDWAFNTKGEHGREIMNDRLIPLISNGDVLLRAAAFHRSMGFFNVKQFFLQASEMAKILSVTPVSGAQAMRQFFINRVALGTENPEALRGLANRWAKMMGVDKEDWLQQIDAFKRSGFSIVGHDQGYLDNINMGGSSTAGKLLQMGTTPFREGELAARNLAYSAAWREYRLANPGKAIDRYGETAILQRAKDLTNNMGRDSNAVWQKGFPSVMTQFMSYHARFMEQLWDGGILSDGRKLTRMEKLRTVVGMSALYGVPIGASGVLGVWPIKESIKSWMSQNGYEYQDTAIEPFMDGFLPLAIEAATGARVDVSQTYGPGGIPAFHDLINGDKTWLEILSGASGGLLTEGIKTALGTTSNVVSDMLALDTDEGSFKMVANDLLEPIRLLPMVDKSVQLYQIINTGKWISRSGSTLANDVSVGEALSNMLLGMPPARVSEAFTKLQSKKFVDEQHRNAMKDIRKFTAMGIQSANSGDMDSARTYHKRALSSARRNNVPQREYNKAVSQGMSDTPLTQRAAETYDRFIIRQRNNKENDY